ncbi:LmeA family phospholipid-binding protein [Spirillospora sp. CA-255316]
MRKVLVVLLILVIGGVVAADRLGVRFAQDEIGRQVAAQYNLRQQPEVKIHGFPFLTQAIGGEYEKIDVSIGDWTQAGVTVRDVKVEMRGVGAPLSDVMAGNSNNVTVRTATASAVVPYEVLQQRAPKEVRKIGPKGDDLQVEMAGAIMGFPVSGTAVVSVKPTRGGIVITPVSAGTGAGQIPLSLLRDQLGWTVPVTNLPVGSRISQIQPTPEGLRVSATAENLKMSNLRGV